MKQILHVQGTTDISIEALRTALTQRQQTGGVDMSNTLRYAQLKLETHHTDASCFVRWLAELVIASNLGSIEAMNESQQDKGALTVAIAGTEYEVTITRK